MEAIVIGAAGGVLGVLAVVRLVNSRATRSDDPAIARHPGEPFSWTYTTTSGRVIDALADLGFRLAADDGSAKRFEGGSLLRTRLLGGYFVKPSDLPVTVLVKAEIRPHRCRAIEVRDRIGPIALRDRALAARYALRAEEIRQAVGAP